VTGLSLMDPAMLWWMLLLPAALWLRRRRGAPALTFAPAPLLQTTPAATAPLQRSWRQRLLPLPRLLNAGGIALLGIALARPAESVQLPLQADGIDILLCLDVSSSMAETDLDHERSRLATAVDAASRFVAARPADRIGLLVFARYPDVRCPLTLDHGALRGFLDDVQLVDPDGQEDLTGIGTAVAQAGMVLRESSARSKVVILLTDGEENVASESTPEAIGPLRAARLCEQLGIRVYTIAAGIGKRDRLGRWQPTDTAQVQRLAQITGGGFYQVRDATALARVYATIDRLETVEFEQPRYRVLDRFLPFLLAGTAALLAAWLLQSSILEVVP